MESVTTASNGLGGGTALPASMGPRVAWVKVWQGRVIGSRAMRLPWYTSVVASALTGCSASPTAPQGPVPSASASASAAAPAPSASFVSCASRPGADRAKCELDTCKGEAAACQTRAASLPAEDGAHAVALYEKACEANAMLACAALGGALLNGKPPIEKDLGRGFALVQRACEGDVMEACTMAATAHEAGLKQGGFSLPRDLEKAKTLYTKACDKKIAEACAALGTFYLGEKGAPRDVVRASEILDGACALGSARACNAVAMLGMNEPELRTAGNLETNKKVVEWLRRGCDLNHGVACANLAGATASGVGGLKADRGAADALYDKACKLGAELGCTKGQ